jgi:hypothetical protein
MDAKSNRHRSERNLRIKKYQKWYIKHNYHDHTHDSSWGENDRGDVPKFTSDGKRTSRELWIKKWKNKLFPSKLHELLEDAEVNGYSDIVSWQIHGRAFKIHKAKDFLEKILPMYFQQTKIASFQRQLSLYGFLKITQGHDKGAYYHELFLHGMDFLARKITSQRVKGTFIKGISRPESEPDFCSMPFAVKKATISNPSRDVLESFTQPEIYCMPMSLQNQIITQAERKSLLVECGNLHDTTNFKPVGQVGFEKMACALEQIECDKFLDEWDSNSFSINDDDCSDDTFNSLT